jgi:hypothetical protein
LSLRPVAREKHPHDFNQNLTLLLYHNPHPVCKPILDKMTIFLCGFPQPWKDLTGGAKHLTRTPAAPIIKPGIGCRFDAETM